MHLMSLIQRLAITFSDAPIPGVSVKDVLVTFSMNQKRMPCEFPHKVNCIQNGSTAIRFNSTENVTITTPSPIDICSSAKFGFAADPKSCEHYFHCAHGRPFRRKCPVPLYFNSKILGCDFKHKVQCQNPPTTPHFTPSPPLFSTQPNLVIANI